VYEQRPVQARAVEVRMDVAAFVGLAERGPIDAPVVLESFEEYRAWFGAPGGGRLLGQSVWLFFANGGHRCVVVRAVDRQNAKKARWKLPGLEARTTVLGDPPQAVRLETRDPGGWGNRLEGVVRFQLSPAPALPYVPVPGSPVDPQLARKVLLADPAVGAGARLRLSYRHPVTKALHTLHFRAVAVEQKPTGRVVTLDADVPAEGRTREFLLGLQEVRLELALGMPELAERFSGLALDPAHERYAPRVLEAESRLARLVVPSTTAFLRPDAAAGEDLGAALALEEEHLLEPGGDAEATTTRDHFFQAHGASPSPLDLLQPYDERNEAEPVSLLHLPDLFHPRVVEDLKEPEPLDTNPDALRFDVCAVAPPVVSRPRPLVYPKLGLDAPSALDDVRLKQQQLVQRCEAFEVWWGRVAILDLPPGLTAGDVLRWRRDVRSDRGCAALYAPYLRCAPAEDALAPLVTVPPGGAVCGIIARRERALGVHGAPANEPLAGVVALHDDGLLPEPGFLHEERVNAIRPTERDLRLLGSRTTSDDLDWTHLSVRRVLHWLERQLAIDSRWAVFEPDDRILRGRLSRGVELRLQGLYEAGGLQGRTAAEAYFVRANAPSTGAGEGRVVLEVGVAPAVPAEFIVFELSRLEDGRTRVEVRRGG
jgi:hypothetical protein